MSRSVFQVRVWVPLAVFTAAFLGILFTRAWISAHRSTAAVSVTGYWSAARPAQLHSAMRTITTRLEHSIAEDTARTRGADAARQWGAALATDAANHAQLDQIHAPSVTDSTIAFERWAAGLPTQLTRVRQSGDATISGTGPSTLVHVPMVMSVHVRQAMNASRVFRIPIDVTLAASSMSGSDLTTATWHVSDAVTTQENGLRSIDHPKILQRADIDVVTDTSTEALARLCADEAQASIDAMRRRYSEIGGPDAAAIFVVSDAKQASAVLGESQDHPAGVEPAGWTWETGDVVIPAKEIASSAPLLQRGTVRHELVHVVTLPLLRSERVATMLLEGIAVVEEGALVTHGTQSMVDLSSLRRAFRDQTLGYDQLLRSNESFFGRKTSNDVDLAYLAGYATIMYLDERIGHAQVVRMLVQLRDGVTIDTALAQTAHLTPQQLAVRVRTWTARYVRKQGKQR